MPCVRVQRRRAETEKRRPSKGRIRGVAVLLALTELTILPLGAIARDEPVTSTPHFKFYSDFTANLNDALIMAGNARRAGEPVLFEVGIEKACFDGLSQADRNGWVRAVDYYAEAVSSAAEFAEPQVLLRLELSYGTHDWAEGDARRFIETSLDFRGGAAAAYERCRWPTQDSQNRRWIAGVVELFAVYEKPLATRLPELFGAAWDGLPFTIDAVETVSWAHANALNLDPPGLHVLISTSHRGNQGRAALEVVFHEAAHFLARRGTPLPAVLDEAARRLKTRFTGDLIHLVHFYLVGEAVRRIFAETGGPAYTPLLRAENLCGPRFCDAIERTWPAYIEGESTLEVAAADLIDALNEAR
jgi:hypothetical protein